MKRTTTLKCIAFFMGIILFWSIGSQSITFANDSESTAVATNNSVTASEMSSSEVSSSEVSSSEVSSSEVSSSETIQLIPEPPLMTLPRANSGEFSDFISVELSKSKDGTSLPNPVPNNSTVSMKFGYEFDAPTSYVAGVAYTFNLPALFVGLTEPINIKDTEGTLCATVVIPTDWQNCTITFTQNGIDGGNGNFHIESAFVPEKISNDITKLTFFEGMVDQRKFDIPINFAIDQIEASINLGKSSSQNENDKANSRIKWVVDITPTMKNIISSVTGADILTELNISNTLASGLTLVEDGTNNPTITKNGSTFLTLPMIIPTPQN